MPKVTRGLVLIPENCVGAGTELGFPNMSTCTAVVCVLDDRLVGGHFTRDSVGDRAETQTLCGRIVNAVGGARVNRLVVVGWNKNHNPTAIKNALGLGASVNEAFDVDGTSYGWGRLLDYAMFLYFRFVSAREAPVAWFKRDTKVSLEDDKDQWETNWVKKLPGQRSGYASDITTQNVHAVLRRHYVNL